MRRTLAVIGGVTLAIALSQFPEYAQQYTQRLGGAVDELRIITTEFDSAATAAGLTRPEAIARYGATSDEFIRARGVSMAETFARYERLSASLDRVTGARGFERAFLMPEFLDSDVGRRTLATFQPAVPVTVEGLLYALAGLILGYGLCSAILRLLWMPFKRRAYVRA